MEVINKYRKELIILGVIIEIILLPLIVRNIISLKNKDNNANVNEVINKEFGIMYHDNGTDSYKEYNGNIADALNNGYVLNIEQSKCSDGSGAPVTPSTVLSIKESTVILKSNKTIYCTLYFDKENPNLRTLCKNYTDMHTCMASEKNNTGNVPNLSPTIQGDMYRYQGTDNVANWICFGTTENCGTSEELIDKYMYRIIGITDDGQMQFVKETTIKEDSNELFSYFPTRPSDESITGQLSSACTWEKSLIFKRINGTSNGKIKGTGNSNDGGNTNLFINSLQYDYLNSEMDNSSNWYSLISEHKWRYGAGRPSGGIITMSGEVVFELFMSSNWLSAGSYFSDCNCYYDEGYYWNDSNSITAKIGMLYFHDYYYSYYDGNDESSRGNPNNRENVKKSWLHFRKDNLNLSIDHEWLLPVYGFPSMVVYTSGGEQAYGWTIESNGSYNHLNLTSSFGVRPTFYLYSSAKIASGDGTKSNPFILEF